MSIEKKIDKYMDEGLDEGKVYNALDNIYRKMTGRLSQKDSIRQIAVHYMGVAINIFDVIGNGQVDDIENVKKVLRSTKKDFQEALKAIEKIPKG